MAFKTQKFSPPPVYSHCFPPLIYVFSHYPYQLSSGGEWERFLENKNQENRERKVGVEKKQGDEERPIAKRDEVEKDKDERVRIWTSQARERPRWELREMSDGETELMEIEVKGPGNDQMELRRRLDYEYGKLGM